MNPRVPVSADRFALRTSPGGSGWARFVLGCCVLWLTAALPAGAEDGTVHHFYGLGEMPQFSKRVTSLRERRYLDLVQQRFDFSCGAAATATILRYAYNFDVNEVDVILGLAEVADEELAREKGYSLLDIRHYVETLGLRGRGYELPPEMLAKLRIPTIALLDLRGYKHFVVIRKITEDSVYVGGRYEPRDGRITQVASEISALEDDAATRRTNYADSAAWYLGLTSALFG